MIRYNFYILSILSMLIFNGCAKEGCTDESAANYNITADKDDGSCVYCSGTVEQVLQSRSLNVVDFRFSSPYSNQVVLNIDVAVKLNSYPLRNCGQSGCFIEITATNNTSSIITNLHFEIPVSVMNFGTFGYDFTTPEQLNPGESFTYANINFPSEFSGCASLSQGQSNGTIWSANYN